MTRALLRVVPFLALLPALFAQPSSVATPPVTFVDPSINLSPSESTPALPIEPPTLRVIDAAWDADAFARSGAVVHQGTGLSNVSARPARARRRGSGWSVRPSRGLLTLPASRQTRTCTCSTFTTKFSSP